MKQREIKFRGFDAKQNKWLYGNLITKIDPQHAEDTFWCYLIHDGALSAEVVATESVGQFTGLLDKNGKEIFEGDLFQYTIPESLNSKGDLVDDPMTFIEEVHFVDGAFELNACPLGVFHLEGEIIGNIYQNHDLLK